MKQFFILSIGLAFLAFISMVQSHDLDNSIVSTGSWSYSLTLTTTASENDIWLLWEDVENWKDYDTVLQYSYLENDADFEVGATGYVKARKAPKTKFELIAVDPGKSFIESLKLPFWNTLELKRRVVRLTSKQVAFTHEVEFKGPLKRLMYGLLAKRFKKDLKMVMVNMKELAEAQNTTNTREIN